MLNPVIVGAECAAHDSFCPEHGKVVARDQTQHGVRFASERLVFILHHRSVDCTCSKCAGKHRVAVADFAVERIRKNIGLWRAERSIINFCRIPDHHEMLRIFNRQHFQQHRVH